MDVDGIVSYVSELIGNREIGVTLLAVGRETDDVQLLLDAAGSDLSAVCIDVKTKAKIGAAFNAIVDTVDGHDGVVIGEKAPSQQSLLFGVESDRIATRTVSPVIVVRS